MKDLDIKIKHKQTDDDKGEFNLYFNDELSGEMFYKSYPQGYIDIKHTEINPSKRGLGLAQHLVSAAVMLARDNDWKVMSNCPYAYKVLSRNADYSDVFIEGPVG